MLEPAERLGSGRTTKLTPLVSIGMPVYNEERFIREALDSLLAQTFTDFELIISDNASTDGTEAICKEYAARDPRIRYFRQLENMGAVANFQFVLDQAVGEYFMWAAADDRWHEEFLEACLESMASSASIGAFSNVQFIDTKNTPVGVLRIPKLVQSRSAVLRLLVPVTERTDQFNFGLFRRSVLVNCRPFRWYWVPQYPNALTYPWLTYVLARGKLAVVDRALFFYRLGSGRSSRVVPPFHVSAMIRLNTIYWNSLKAKEASGSFFLGLYVFTVSLLYQGKSIGVGILKGLFTK